ncbi:glycerophosphoryl diester phosphodiesterase membrane domain-containing protein [Lactovum odontotermitis]
MKLNFKVFFRTYLREFRSDWLRYLSLFVGMNLLLTLVIIPVFNWLVGLVMSWSGIPFISYNNLGNLLTQHLPGMLGLFVLLIVLLAVIFVQFAIQFHGVRLIQQGVGRFRMIVGESLRSLRRLSLQAFLFFIFYFLLILPFGRIVFSTPLLSKVKIPVFTMGFFMANWRNMLILGAFYLITFMIGSRFIFVLPGMILKGKTLKQALKDSLDLTHLRRFVYFVAYFALIGVLTMILSEGGKFLIYLLQLLLDMTPLAFAGSIVLLTAGEIWGMLISALAAMLFFSFLIRELGFPLEKSPRTPTRSTFRIASSIFGALAILLLGLSSWFYLSGGMDHKVLAISHRGVDNDNGVQNTLPALELTAREKPDYVEMDIQETADHQFVVFHDASLKELTGVNKTAQEMTLSELTKLTVTEKGKSAPLVSFDDYFASAEKLGQKLLIEIKTSPRDSSDILNIFVQKYGARILKNKDMVHSLDYGVITGLKKLEPAIPVSFILPLNLAFPQTDANAYTEEETTLDSDFVIQAHNHKQQVYAWTINDTKMMQRQIVYGVDGIITDKLSDLQKTIKDSEGKNISYAERLLVLFSLEPNPGDNAVN